MNWRTRGQFTITIITKSQDIISLLHLLLLIHLFILRILTLLTGPSSTWHCSWCWELSLECVFMVSHTLPTTPPSSPTLPSPPTLWSTSTPPLTLSPRLTPPTTSASTEPTLCSCTRMELWSTPPSFLSTGEDGVSVVSQYLVEDSEEILEDLFMRTFTRTLMTFSSSSPAVLSHSTPMIEVLQEDNHSQILEYFLVISRPFNFSKKPTD